MTQRKTQTAAYWQEKFSITSENVEAVYNYILETGQPSNLDEISILLIKRHCDAEELATRNEFQEGDLYQPKESYAVNDKLVFPAYNFAMGTVASVRAGNHPSYAPFSVMTVEFAGDATKEFVSDFKETHPLNIGEDQSLANLQGLLSPEELYQTYQKPVAKKVAAFLNENEYFLRDMLPEFNEGLFNIADAAIDINGGPLGVDALIEQMGLVSAGTEITNIDRFSVSYQLANDERFDDVGPTGQVLWYLERIEPPEAHHPPRRLQAGLQDYDPTEFDDDFMALLQEIDDELTHPDDAGEADDAAKQTTIVLNYPHWRVGTIPLTAKTLSFFPKSYYNPVLFEFVDGRTGNTFPGWTVLDHQYVFGLDQWYQKNKLPVGAYIILKKTDNPMQVVVDYKATRTQRDWVRMANVVGRKLGFQMNPAALGCQYDELMIISDPNPENTDVLWLNAEERDSSVFDLLCRVFPELSKLNPQSTVHAKTLYSAVNVMKRVSPGVIFHELLTQPCFAPMNHGYWTYDPNLRD